MHFTLRFMSLSFTRTFVFCVGTKQPNGTYQYKKGFAATTIVKW